MPKQAPHHHYWEWAFIPWYFFGHMHLVGVDAHSKWPEVIMTKYTTSAKTVEILKTIFARNGLPEQFVSDNRPQFESDEYKEFVRQSGIVIQLVHLTV